MRIVIISGRSGSGKSTALHVMEDAGFYCIDNLPAALLPALVENMIHSSEKPEGIAVSIDARNTVEDLFGFPEMLARVRTLTVDCEIVFLDADDETLLIRFSETRRKHPLSNEQTDLREAIAREKILLGPIAEMADVRIDTSRLNLYELRDQVQERVVRHANAGLVIQFQSFGFKSGLPTDADFVFDIRCLPNPHWRKELRDYTGLQKPVIEFLRKEPAVQAMLEDIRQYLERWIPVFAESNRTYLTIAVGCTGGKHRSVYLCEELKKHFSDQFDHVQIKHRELQKLPQGKK